MLMLIANQDEVTSISNKHFNTSHVNVNQVKVLHHQQKNIYFNTSHVNVNHALWLYAWTLPVFQYISC